MRNGLRALTLRGRLLLLAAVVVAATAVLLGQRDFLRLAVLFLALPIGAAILTGRARFRIASTRSISPPRIGVGQQATVHLELRNVARSRSGLIMVADRVPGHLGTPPRIVLQRVEAGGTRTLDYPIVGTSRGRFAVGPLSLTVTDPFGLCRLTRSFVSTDSVVVTPPVTNLPAVALPGMRAGVGETRSRAVAHAGYEDVIPRDYRVGDDLRRVHWGATARAGELMVRREEEPWRSRAIVLIDTRAGAHTPVARSRPTEADHRAAAERPAAAPAFPDEDDRTDSFEVAVATAASTAIHLARRGFAVRIADLAGRAIVSPSADDDIEGAILDALAVLDRRADDLVGPGASLRRDADEGVMVAVLGSMSSSDTQRLARMHRGNALSVAIALDVEQAGGAPAPATADRLLRSGWRATAMDPDEPLGPVWARAAVGNPTLVSRPGPGTPLLEDIA